MSRYMLYTDCNGCEEYYPVDTLEIGLSWARDFIINWMEYERSSWRRENGKFVLSQSDIENWNCMIENNEVYVVDLYQIDNMDFSDTSTDEYDYRDGHYYYPLKKAEKLGWVEMIA